MADKKVVLLHSNDIHGDFLPKEKDGKQVGGVSLLSGYIRRERDTEKNVLYANAGDMFRGSIIDSEFQGLSTIEIMNYMSPDIVTVGNHEADYGIAHLLFLEKCARFPIINANLYVKSNHARLFKPYEILEIDGLKFMFIGILTEEVLAQTRSEKLIGTFVDIWEAAKQIGVIIDNYKTTAVDYTVLLTHIGFEEDKKLAELLDPDWGIDLIIGGHSHTLLSEPCYVNGIPIVQVGTGSDHIGKVTLKFGEDRKLKKFDWECVEINEDTSEPDAIMDQLLNTYKNETDKKYGRIITTFKRPLTHPHRNMETELGNLFADLLQVDSSFDVMLMSSGAIRKTEMGPIVTYQDLKECVPYDDPVAMLHVTGAQFRHMIKFMLRDEAMQDRHTEFYQLSKGMRVVYDYNTKELVEFKLNGEDIKDDDMIKIAIQEGFHLGGFTEFFDVDIKEVLKNAKQRRVMTSCFAIFEELLSQANNVDSQVEGRIVILNKPEEVTEEK